MILSFRPRSLYPALTLALFALPLGAQSEASFEFYHGTGRTSRISVDNANAEVRNHKRKFELVLRPGALVCVTIVNAHPANYKYSLDAVVDTTRPPLPDLSPITAFIKGLPGYLTSDTEAQKNILRLWQKSAEPGAAADTSFEGRLGVIVKALELLKPEVDYSAAAAKASDNPEPFGQRQGSDSGFRGAVRRIAALSKEAYHFNDPKLKENFAREIAKVREWAGSDRRKVVIADGLASTVTLLLTARDQLKATFAPSVVAAPRLCKAVADGKNTITLAVAKVAEDGTRDTFAKDDKGEPAMQIEVEARYQRKAVSLDPLTLVAFTSQVPSFAIRNDTLRQDRVTDPTIARPGTMLHLNVKDFGPAGQFGVGFGAGIGFSSKDVVSDLLVGATLSYRDAVRVGVGFGRSSQPESVKDAEVGQRIPANFGKLEDAVTNGKLNSKAWYLLVTIPGLAIGK